MLCVYFLLLIFFVLFQRCHVHIQQKSLKRSNENRSVINRSHRNTQQRKIKAKEKAILLRTALKDKYIFD